MEIDAEESKKLTEAFAKLSKEVLNLHRDVLSISRCVMPNEKIEESRAGRWPPIKTAVDVRVALAWLAGGFESLRDEMRVIRARLDVVMNDSHAYDEMKAYLKRPPPGRRRDDR